MNFRLTLTALAFAFAAVPALAADYSGAVRFRAGQSGAVVSGALSGLKSCDYTLSARKGQTLRAALNRSSLDLIVVEPVERDFASGDALVLDRDGLVTLRVLQTRLLGGAERRMTLRWLAPAPARAGRPLPPALPSPGACH